MRTSLEAGQVLQVVTHSPEETMEFARQLAQELEPPCLILLEGELGSGKTTLTKGLVVGLGAAREEEVTSPSFTLVHEYGRERKVYHVDLYRVEDPRELPSLGLDELLAEQATVIVEWGKKLGDNASAASFRIHFEHLGGDDRRITVERLGA